ncbi:NupC/NupG family nucleoside CNT transporter [Georgenia wutianyii]|uniref:NupC/NupG family nucleoside CNT transporter n=1 Tax=Georgenia wutianyii TaxID=2585135 RepID=A0ABX5VKX5_9MICO|nr:nucleoside transporter C-terminal domain-containing protein [Georgenia wutianyii]QDB78813.1 NupC/NupG family nucleoside CNT transporter [Georgenia wutianyii]
MVLVLAIAWLLSVDRRRINYRTITLALLIQITFGFLVLYVPAGRWVLEEFTTAVQAVINSSSSGIDFLFGPILPDEGSVFAFQVLPVIVFFASLTAVLYYIGALQLVTRWIGGGLAKVLGTTGPESMNAAANIFVGQTEAPLVIRPYIKHMTPSEVFAVMAGGLTTVAGSVLVGYSLLGANLEYLIAASFMAAPAGLLMAKMLVPAGALSDIGPNAVPTDGATTTARTPVVQAPDTVSGADTPEVPRKAGGRKEDRSFADRARAAFQRGARRGATVEGRDELVRRVRAADEPADADTDDDTADDDEPVNVIDAASRGASDGLGLALNVGAMLLAFISLVALLNIIFGAIGSLFGVDDLSVQQILGYVFAPVMTAVGVPINEAVDAGSFLGQKVVLNEFVAFSDFAPRAEEFSAKSQAIITFALTGFANLGSLAILLGGLGGIAPTQRGVIATLGLRAVLAGTLGNLMSAAIAGILIG